MSDHESTRTRPLSPRGQSGQRRQINPPPAQPLPEPPRDAQTAELLRELVAHLRDQRTQLREEWLRRIIEARLLTAMSRDETYAEATSIYDQYVEALEAGAFEALQAYAQNLSERIIPRGVETNEVVGIVLLLRDVLARALFIKYHSNLDKLNEILDAYEPAANRIAITVAVGFVQERERVIREQQEAIRELSTPVLQVRERLLILPIIGLIDPQRARQITEQLLVAIRSNRARVVVIDITGVPVMDTNVANHLVQTVEASRLLGATVIVTGLSPDIAQTLVNIGVDLGKMNTVGDLQGGIEEAEHILGYKVSPVAEAAEGVSFRSPRAARPFAVERTSQSGHRMVRHTVMLSMTSSASSTTSTVMPRLLTTGLPADFCRQARDESCHREKGIPSGSSNG